MKNINNTGNELSSYLSHFLRTFPTELYEHISVAPV